MSGATAGTAGALVGSPVKAGATWTLVKSVRGCEVQVFGPHHRFAANRGHDAGTYAARRGSIHEVWTGGAERGMTFQGLYSRASDSYVGIFAGRDVGETGELVPGALAGC